MTTAPQLIVQDWPALMDKHTAGAYLGTSYKTIERFYKDGELPATKLRGSDKLLRFDRRDLDALRDRERLRHPA